MKNLRLQSWLLIFIFLITGCGGKESDPTPSTATFRIDFSQTGDYEKFVKIITISGGEFKYRGTNDVMPPAILGANSNVPSFSVEAANVDELEISTLTGFITAEDGPATMTMKFIVYKNGVLLEEKSFTYTEVTNQKSELLVYKAK